MLLVQCKLPHQQGRKEASLMKKHTISLQLIQNFLSKEDLEQVQAEFQHTETARKCSTFVLISYLIQAAANEWKSLRHAADVGVSLGLAKLEHSSFSKHLKSLDYNITKRPFEIVVQKYNRSARRKLRIPKKTVID